MSVPRPTPTIDAISFQTAGKRIETAANAANSTSPIRRIACARAPRERNSRATTAMTVATQLGNLRAVQFYGRRGLRVVSAELWFHFWPSEGHG